MKARLTKAIRKRQVDNETTAGHPDHREQLDLSTPHPIPGPDKPAYHNLLAPNQWPSATHMPQFRPVFEEYMARMSRLSSSRAGLPSAPGKPLSLAL